MRAAALLLAGWLCSPLVQAADPLVIAHRGASGYLPEHTLAGDELAVKLGADFTLAEIKAQSARTGRRVGICPEAKRADPALAAAEYQAFLAMGLDGLFGHYSDLAVAARNDFVAASRR